MCLGGRACKWAVCVGESERMRKRKRANVCVCVGGGATQILSSKPVLSMLAGIVLILLKTRCSRLIHDLVLAVVGLPDSIQGAVFRSDWLY